MESLALAVAVIVSPAMYGGPLVLLLSLWRRESISKFRLIFIRVIGGLAFLSGAFLIVENISRGSTIIGLIGVSTSAIAIWRTK
jgi:hypothetical protein